MEGEAEYLTVRGLTGVEVEVEVEAVQKVLGSLMEEGGEPRVEPNSLEEEGVVVVLKAQR